MLAIAVLWTSSADVALSSQQSSDADARELAGYRLTLPNLQRVINVNRAVLQALVKDPKVQESLQIDAELETLAKKERPTDADEKRIAELEARKDELEAALDNPLGGETRTLSEMESRIKQYRPMADALQREGMRPREYATFWLTFLQASFAYGFQKSGMLKQLPADVHPDNLKFIADHEREIMAMQKELEVIGRKQ